MDSDIVDVWILIPYLSIYIVQGAAKVSILMIGQQAIMDAYLCLLHLTAGILVGEFKLNYDRATGCYLV